MEMTGKIAVVTGGARGIGRAICDALRAQGARVATIDVLENEYFVGDIAHEETLDRFADKVCADFGAIDYLVNNAMVSKGGMDRCGYADFVYALKVGVAAPYHLARRFSSVFREGGAIVNISSTRRAMSQQNTESYTAAKGGIDALTHALAASLAGRVRVNAVAPGWIDTEGGVHSAADRLQHAVGRVGVPDDIVQAVLFLLSEKSGFITGQTLTADGGMSARMIYHGDEGWAYQPREISGR
jgi:NAD(P)-dependent dehydrogenase (short-subunit alcohol dehydrogenase family)